MLGFVGDTLIETSGAEVTVRSVLPDMPARVAVIVVVPAPTDAARPFEPAALLISATPAGTALHVTYSVRSWLVLSE